MISVLQLQLTLACMLLTVGWGALGVKHNPCNTADDANSVPTAEREAMHACVCCL